MDSLAVHLMPADPPQYRIVTHPGEMGRRVMPAHPPSVNAGSTAGERRTSAADDVLDVCSRSLAAVCRRQHAEFHRDATAA